MAHKEKGTSPDTDKCIPGILWIGTPFGGALG